MSEQAGAGDIGWDVVLVFHVEYPGCTDRLDWCSFVLGFAEAFDRVAVASGILCCTPPSFETIGAHHFPSVGPSIFLDAIGTILASLTPIDRLSHRFLHLKVVSIFSSIEEKTSVCYAVENIDTRSEEHTSDSSHT